MKTLDIDECAEFLKVDKSTALKLAAAGTLPGARIGRAWVFLLDDLVEYLRAEARRQVRERQARQGVAEELEATAARVPSMVLPKKRGREKTPRADLSAYELPELVGQHASA